MNLVYKRLALNFLHRLRVEADKLTDNRSTRPTATDKHSEWRSYIGLWDDAAKTWEDLCWRAKYPDVTGNAFLVLGSYSSDLKPEKESIFKALSDQIKGLVPAEWITSDKDRVIIEAPVNTNQAEDQLHQSIAEIQNKFISLLPIFVRLLDGKIAKVKSLIPVQAELDFVPNWDENTNQVLIVAGNWAYPIAQKYGIYECQNNRSFRSSKYIAFYDDGKIQELFEIVGRPYDNATSSNTPEILKMSLDIPNYNGNSLRRCFKLKSLGKIGPVVNDSKSKSGKNVPFTYGQPRYTTVDLIRKAKLTSELIHGLRPELISDVFVNDKIKKAPKIDILWVIDNSGSMSSYQELLGKNFNSFINYFVSKPISEIPDFNMAITTTDTGENGRLRGDDVLNKDWVMDKELKELVLSFFPTYVRVGTSGSATEQGLKCSVLALEKNPAFFRADAPVIINIVTDEEDDDKVPVRQYLDRLNALKSGQRVIINLIGLSGFSRYQEAVNNTRGKYLDIKSDFSNILESISGQMIEMARAFPLSQLPKDSKQLKIIVNGNESTDYTYDPGNNSLKVGKSIPENASFEVQYEIETD